MTTRLSERMSGVDAAWLRMDDPTNLMVISGVIQLGEPLELRAIHEVITTRLLRYDRFRMRVTRPAVGRLRWGLDQDFDLRRHVMRAELDAPGDRAALQALIGELMSTPLPSDRPLWQVHVIDNYEGGTALVFRIHHAMADGFALLGVMLSLTEAQQEARSAQPPSAGYPSSLPLAIGAERRDWQGVVREPARAVAMAKLGASGAAALGRLLALRAEPRTALKGRLGVAKQAAWSEPIALSVLKEASRRAGASINDLLLACVAGALREHLIRAGSCPSHELHAVVPVNLRPAGAPERLGNAFGLAFVGLPVGIADASERLAAVHRSTEAMKGSAEPVAAYAVLSLLGSVRPRWEETAVKLFGSKATAVITNVPGPREVRTLAGKPIRTMLFFVPQSARLGLGFSILSYAGEVVLGVAADAALVRDAGRLVQGCLQELRALGCRC